MSNAVSISAVQIIVLVQKKFNNNVVIVLKLQCSFKYGNMPQKLFFTSYGIKTRSPAHISVVSLPFGFEPR